MKVAFIGDISFNDAYVDLHKQGERPFDAVGRILKRYDYVIGNLECLSKGDNGENEYERLRLKQMLKHWIICVI